MEKKVIVVCCVVGLLGLLSAATGFAAEAKRIKGSDVEFPSPAKCVYPRSPAFALGLTAAIALIIAQVIINVATGCCICCRRGRPHRPNYSWTLALICFVVSWFTFVIAFLLLLTGAALNDQHNLNFGDSNCYVVKPGVFATAAVLSLATVVLGVLCYYLAFTSARSTDQLLPQSTQDPVFVHEDTYMRRQLA